MELLKFIALFTFSNGGNQYQQGGYVPLMWPFVVAWRHFDVAWLSFEEILQYLKINNNTRDIF